MEEQTAQPQKPLYRHPAFYALVLVILIVGLAIALMLPKSNNNDLQSAEYETGLEKDRVVVGVNTGFDGLYPLTSNTVGSDNLTHNVFEGLTILSDGEVKPGLATSWTNPDNLTWRFNLRRDVEFTSGDSFTAKDVKYTIEAAKASADTESEWVSASRAARVDSVTVIDDYTVDLKTARPDSTLLSWLVWAPILSEAQIKKDGLDKAVGTGPYKVTSVLEDEAILDANTNYWGGAPKVKQLVIKVHGSETEVEEALVKGTFDIATFRRTKTATLAAKGFQVTKVQSGNVTYLLPDVNSATSPFKDVKVRKAAYLALDAAKLIADGGVLGAPLTQFGSPELVGYNTSLSRPSQNIAEAKKLLTEAGYPNGFTVVLDSGSPTGQPEPLTTAIGEQLAEIGIIVTHNVLSPIPTPGVAGPPAFFAKLFSGSFALIRANYNPDTIDSLDLIDTLFHTRGAGRGSANVSSYSNTELDEILDEAAATFAIAEKIKLTQQAHALIMEDLPGIPVHTATYDIVGRDNVAFKAMFGTLVLGRDLSGRAKTSN